MNLACHRKAHHLSRGKAEAALRSLIARSPAEASKLHVYLCSSCKHYHVGHKIGSRS